VSTSIQSKGDFQTVRDISVIFPAFNEEGNIRCTVETALKVLPKVATRWEVIVVDDGSSDATALICDDLKARYPEVEVICHGQNRGYGAALKTGIMSAKYELIFFSDSDGQFDLRDLQQLISWSEDYDIVAGYRAKRHDPLHRRINALGWNALVRLVLGIKIRDIDCAFKLFRRSVFDQVQIRCVGAMVNTDPCPGHTAWHADTPGQSKSFAAALWETVRRQPPRYHHSIS
jgi:glycosyltransferase involved in cell wall biosynthesis